MTDWMSWFVLAGVLVILEIFTGTFYLLMVGLALAAAGFAALTGAEPAMQYLIAALVGVSTTYALRRSKLGRRSKVDATRDPGVNLDIGEKIMVKAWKSEEGGVHAARTMYRGAMWDVELTPGETAVPGLFTIAAIRGSRLIVTSNFSSES